jgi:hypothetical protein
MPERVNLSTNSGDDEPVRRLPGKLPSELQSLEARLAALAPRDDRLDRERLMFLAGQASVDAANQRRVSLCGLNLAATAWPRAFAAMTVVAATLIVMLLTRLSITGVSSPTSVDNVASGSRPLETGSRLSSALGDMRTDVLSAGDARSEDIDQLLARRSADLAVTTPADDRDRPTLTPAAWRQVIGDNQSPVLPTGDSSHLPMYRGTKS